METINESKLKEILCDFLTEWAKRDNRHIISKCKCFYNGLDDSYQCSVKMSLIREDIMGAFISEDTYHKNMHIYYTYYYPPGADFVKLSAKVYLSELEQK